MKLVEWNCHIGFNDTKKQYISTLNADIYIIAECLESDFSGLFKFVKYQSFYTDKLENDYGIAICSNTYRIERLPTLKDYRFVVPFKVSNGIKEFIIFAIWTKIKGKYQTYTEQIWNALNDPQYAKLLEGNIIITGDFNTGNYWNKDYQSQNIPSHQQIVDELNEHGIKSAYHVFNNCEQGNEHDSTLHFMYKTDAKNQFHIDYCFYSSNFVVNNVVLENVKEWSINKYSDHSPLIIDFGIDRIQENLNA
ncbi:MAG: endonuclease/exonuclease/phosphatase family protein [Spirochaetaceae bacterium]|jgi:hypothetical protein|nr:endonuclease/exonuclease/phosphatase family protein [Spirochaetaceae bacterium]